MIPTPSQLCASFDRGEIEREELQALMALHARELIQEMEEDHQNPAAALLETLLARRAASQLVKRHGARLIREILIGLAELPDFPPVRHLWNAAHPDVPLHCFLRIRREPVFRIASLTPKPGGIIVIIEHGPAGRGKATRQTFLLARDANWKLRAESM
jgi:hypothetical protein